MKRFLILGALLALAISATAKENIVLPDLLKGDVVLQQKTDARLWGKAAPGATLKVRTSWDRRTYETRVGADSLWFVSVATPEAGFTPYDITFSCGPDKLVLEDVLIGDVWFCGGQSNMEMPLKGMFGCYVEGADEAIAMSGRNKGLRYVTVARHKATEEDGSYFTEGSWTASSPATAADFSATAFFFGEALSEALGIPIGLISCSWSGSFIEDWMSSELFEKYPDQKVFGAEFTKAPTNYYYGMLKPASNYTIKGMIWYQGESNVGSPDYAERLAAAVELWKSDFGLERMPFYIVELAPYLYNNGYEEQCPYLREQQFEAGRLIPDSGMISTYDLAYDYETTMIHPARKKEVGRRLAWLALSRTYGYGNPAEGPVYSSMRVEGSEVMVRFDNAENGFRVAGPLKGFELAGADKVFHAAEAEVVMKFGRGEDGGFMVRVTSDKVPEPVAVRYCFRDFLVGNLYNVEGWPAVPFRSDDWDSSELGRPSQQQDLMTIKAGVLKETLTYSVKDGQELLMDKYVDPSVPYDGRRPVLIYAFGGGFAMGSRASSFQIPYYNHFLDRGFIVLAIDYRLGVKPPEEGSVDDLPVPEGFETRFDYAVRIACEDMIDATAYVVAHADEWGADASEIILSGSSAGAMTSLNAAYEVAGCREFSSRLPEDFNYGGVISLAGCIYVPEKAPVWKKAPCPILFFHGSDDPTVPFDTRPQGGCWCYGSNYLHEQFTELGFPHWLYEETGSDHIIAMTPLARNYNEIDTFLEKFVGKGMKLIIHTVFTADPPATDETVGFRIFD